MDTELHDLKIAVCISGEPRMYEHTYERFNEYFKRLEEAGHTVDIFIHAWSTTSTPRNYQDGLVESAQIKKYEDEYSVEEIRKDLIAKYKPRRILVETKNVLDDLVEHYGVRCEPDQIKNSNFLAMSQHISGERSASLKAGTDIILPSEIIIGKPTDNDYDIVIRTRFDVMLFAERSQFINIAEKILGFETVNNKRTPTGMTFFPSMTVRDGIIACEFGHFWSGNTQFDNMYRNMFGKIHSRKDVDIYESCHHHVFATHCMAQKMSMRQWRMVTKPREQDLDPEGGRDFIWAMPNSPTGDRYSIEDYRACYKEYGSEHRARMGVIDDQIREEDERKLRVQKEYTDNMNLVASGKLKDIWYNGEVYFVSPTEFSQMGDTDIAHLPIDVNVKWCNLENKWVAMSDGSI